MEEIFFKILGPGGPADVDAASRLDGPVGPGAVNAAFLAALCGPQHPSHERALNLLSRACRDPDWGDAARLYLRGLDLIQSELRERRARDRGFAGRLADLDRLLSSSRARDPRAVAEGMWAVFCPEAAGILGNESRRVRELRERRRVTITRASDSPVLDPGRELLFTSNVLLTVPPGGSPAFMERLSPELRAKVEPVLEEPQQYWYDHPVPVGVEPGGNEILYGLRGLDRAMAFEKARGTLAADSRPVCILSVSVTHAGLQRAAKDYIRGEIRRDKGFRNLRAFAFTEPDARRLVSEVLAPAASEYLGSSGPAEAMRVLGVDGEYGRHYSFLKAIAALWQVLADPGVKAAFKIDLDQVFPQEALVKETGASGLEHLCAPLWGACGLDRQGRRLDLDMMAGALVNSEDAGKLLFTPDVAFPQGPATADELFFFSRLPQALSTEAEMTARYGPGGPDGRGSCLERIHVTGGTTGIRVDGLRRHRPFTPSFMGRAEDQAYIIGSMAGTGPRPAYLHRPGLIMRHDKEEFAAEAVRSARISKMIGDHVRILLFSAYARALEGGEGNLKQALSPFTGAFISEIPNTVALLRYALRALRFFDSGGETEGAAFVREGAGRIRRAFEFTGGDPSPLARTYGLEREGWDLYYDTLSALEKAIRRGERTALALREKARRIIEQCDLQTTSRVS